MKNNRMTVVFEWPEGVEQPAINGGTEFFGGKCVAVQFNDALQELEETLEELEECKFQRKMRQ